MDLDSAFIFALIGSVAEYSIWVCCFPIVPCNTYPIKPLQCFVMESSYIEVAILLLLNVPYMCF